MKPPPKSQRGLNKKKSTPKYILKLQNASSKQPEEKTGFPQMNVN